MARSSVEGLDKFREHLKGLAGSYVVIGGTACDILLSEAGLPFRATRDLDTVLVANDRLPETIRAIWSLVKDGGYRCGWGRSDKSCYYRFTDPAEYGYPRMVELFCKKPQGLMVPPEVEVIPIHVDDEVSSLSAILLDDDYYDLMLDGVETVEGISILKETHLIPFKAKAYLDLRGRRENGEHVDSKKIKKHKRDILRLAQLLTGAERIKLSKAVASDMRDMLRDYEADPVDLKQIGISNMTMKDIVLVLKKVYFL